MEGIIATRGGAIVARETGRGIGPALKLYKEGRLKGCDVADHIVGRAAAALFIAGGAVRVQADVMSRGAADFLVSAGLSADAETLVDVIVNRKGTGACPMETAVEGLTDPLEMIAAIERTLASLGKF